MDAIMNLLGPYLPANFNLEEFLTGVVVLCGGIFLFGVIGRLLFGKKSVLNQSVSSAIGILFIYIVTVVIYSTGVNLGFLISPLPFIELNGEHLHIFNFLTANFNMICYQLLNMIILAFLVNLVHSWLPAGKKLLGWYFYRCLTVLIAMVLNLIASAILSAWMPADILEKAPTILLIILLAMMMVGGLKMIVGIALTFINPLVAVLYTFFFSSAVGKQLSKAVLTTGLLAGLVLALNYFGVTAVFIGSAVLTAYIPLLVVLLLIWYIIGHIF